MRPPSSLVIHPFRVLRARRVPGRSSSARHGSCDARRVTRGKNLFCPLRPLSEALPFPIPFFKGVAKTALYYAH